MRRLQVQALRGLRSAGPLHLIRRFFQVLRPDPLTPAEQALVARSLNEPEHSLFWAQAVADQRHALETMRRASTRTADPTILRAALLHDVGKGGVGLGAFGRSVATVLDALGLPMTARMTRYRRHGEIGAGLLERLGVEPIAVDFARRHPDADPGSADPEAWQILLAADDV